MKKISILFLLLSYKAFSVDPSFRIALLKYNGGGDWYANLETSLPNLIQYSNKELSTNIDPEQAIVEASSPDIFNFPFIHMTGHGNWVLSSQEAENLRKYLVAGGFLHIDDNYGMDPYVRPQMKKVFPELDFVELPFSHPLFHQKFDFPNGLPKIHEHDQKAPQAFALIFEGRLVCLYTYQCDLGDGWEDYEVHKDSPENHIKALKMGANIISYVFKDE